MRGKSRRIRFAVMLAFLALVAVGYFTAGGIGNVCAVGFDTITALCPLGALMVLLSEKTMVPLAAISVVAALVVCVLLGRVFCSWICPVHFMTHRKGADRRRGKKAREKAAAAAAEGEPAPSASGCAGCAHPCGKSKGVKLDSRHAILAGALGSTLVFGFPVLCLVCPVGLTFATVLLVMRLFAFGETTWTIVAFIAIIAAEVFLLPKWCHRFCPLGALMSLLSAGNRTLRPTVDAETCLRTAKGVDCDACTRSCPEQINLVDIASGATTLNDCTKCRSCAEACPVHAIGFPILPAKSDGGAAAAREEG